jgi:hypothetical protein
MRRASKQHSAPFRALLAALAAGAAITSAGLAVAQPRPPRPPPPPPAATTPGDTQKATQLYQKGSELFKAKRFIPALEQFRASYATVASPNSHLYIARCLAAMGETQKAWLEFDAVAEEASTRGDKYLPTRDSANVERDELGAKLGLVTVSTGRAEPNAALRIGGWEVPRDRWGRPFPVDPGTYEVRLEAPGRPANKTTVTVMAGDRRAVTLDTGGAVARSGPAPAPASKINGLRVAGIAASGVGVAGMVMFAVGGAMSKGTYADLKTKCGGDTGGCGGVDVSSDISKGKTQQAIGNAGLIIGAVGVATGVTLIVLSTRKKGDDARPAAQLTVGPSWAGVTGSF